MECSNDIEKGVVLDRAEAQLYHVNYTYFIPTLYPLYTFYTQNFKNLTWDLGVKLNHIEAKYLRASYLEVGEIMKIFLVACEGWEGLTPLKLKRPSVH